MKFTRILLMFTIFTGVAYAQNISQFVISDEAGKKSPIPR
jgi:hypothetical protein